MESNNMVIGCPIHDPHKYLREPHVMRKECVCETELHSPSGLELADQQEQDEILQMYDALRTPGGRPKTTDDKTKPIPKPDENMEPNESTELNASQQQEQNQTMRNLATDKPRKPFLKNNKKLRPAEAKLSTGLIYVAGFLVLIMGIYVILYDKCIIK